jgi:hypothetical protein
MVARGHAAFDAAAWGAKAARGGKRAKPGTRRAVAPLPPPPRAELQRSTSPTRARAGNGAARAGGARRGIDPDADSIFGARDDDAFEEHFADRRDDDDTSTRAPQLPPSRALAPLPSRRDAARGVAAARVHASQTPMANSYADTSVAKPFAPSGAGGRSAETALRDMLASEDAPASLKHYTRGGGGGGGGSVRGAASARSEVWDSSDDRDSGRYGGGSRNDERQQQAQERQWAQQQQQQTQQQRLQRRAPPPRGLERDSFDEEGEDDALGNYGEFSEPAPPRAASPTRRRQQQPYAPPQAQQRQQQQQQQQQRGSYRDDEGGAAWASAVPEMASPRMMMGGHAEAAAAPYAEQQLARELASAYQIATVSPRPVGQSRLAAAAAARNGGGASTAAAAAYGGNNGSGYGNGRPLGGSLDAQATQATWARAPVSSSYDAGAHPW